MHTPDDDPSLARRDDRILPLTRWVAWAVIPFLLAAFLILYVDGRHTAQWFAWEIPSRLTTALMGAGYLGGAYFFLRVALGAGEGPDPAYVADDTAVGWHGLLGVGALTLGADARWSAWSIPMQSISLWMVLMLAALFLHQGELGPAGPANWYTLFVAGGLLGLFAVWLVARAQPPQT